MRALQRRKRALERQIRGFLGGFEVPGGGFLVYQGFREVIICILRAIICPLFV